MLKEIREVFTDNFAEATQAGNIIQGVSIMSTNVSRNGYTYTEKAQNKLVQLGEGSKIFLDHFSSDAKAKRDGVRSVSDWAGVFGSVKKEGQKISGSITVRESFKPLFKDIITMRPRGVGMSINSSAMFHKDAKGQETIVDIVKLRSIDLVSEAAMTSNLFESMHRDDLSEEEKDAIEATFLARIKGTSVLTEALTSKQQEAIDRLVKCSW